MRKNGEYIWVMLSAKIAERDVSGKENLVIGGIVNINEVKKAEAAALESNAAAREAEDRLRVMIDASPSLISLWDESGKPVECNIQTAKIFKLKDRYDWLSDFSMILPEYQSNGRNSIEMASDAVVKAFETGRQDFIFEYLLPSGEIMTTETSLVRIPRKNGFRLCGYSRDISEQIRSEKHSREADAHAREMEIEKRAAEAANEAKSSFLASISH
jgi:PAS domain-containing protein